MSLPEAFSNHDRLRSAASILVKEAQRLLQNASDCQASMRKLQRELAELRCP